MHMMHGGMRNAEKTLRALNRIGRYAAHLVKRFVRSERGNTAMIFALASIGLVTAAGAAVDWSRAMVTKTRLSEALDAAGLAFEERTILLRDDRDRRRSGLPQTAPRDPP